METKRIFIVGVGRSGTSLLQGMLNSHPMICFPPEINFVRRFLSSSKFKSLCENDATSIAKLMVEDEYIKRLNLPPKHLIKTMLDETVLLTPKHVYNTLLKMYASNIKRQNIKWYGDKDPRSIEYLNVIKDNYPDARILHIIRDPRDVLVSKKKAQWSKGRPVLQHIFANKFQLKIGRQHGLLLFGKNYYELAYENLITEPTDTLTKLCEFLDLNFDQDMLEFHKRSESITTPDELPWKKELFQPLMRENTGNWSKELDPWESNLIEMTCKEAFDEGAYKRSGVAMNTTDKIKVNICAPFINVSEPIYRIINRK